MKSYFLLSVLFCIVGSVTLAPTQDQTTAEHDFPLFTLLDGNGNGNLDPYEALDALLQIQDEHKGKKLSGKLIQGMLREAVADKHRDVAKELKAMDSNGDGKITLEELDEEAREFARMVDKNKDGTVTFDEAMEFEFDEDFFMSQEDIQEEVKGIFGEFDKNQDGKLSKDEAIDDEFPWSRMSEGDSDGNNKVTKAEMTAFLTADNQKAVFKISGNVAVMSGVINSETPSVVLRLIHEHPNVRTIEMANVPGSIDDEANLRAARYVRKFGFATIIKSNGSVASGGTDFFLAGKKRTVEKGGKLGIHSWGGPDSDGRDVPRDDPQHQLYLKYYKEIGIPAGFYWRTLEAAPASDIHWMTEEEIKKFKVCTNRLSPKDETRKTKSTDSTPAVVQQGEVKLTGEAKMMMSLLDLNDNGQLEASELEGDAREMLEEVDSNKDGIITKKELMDISDEQIDVHSKLAAIDTHKNLQRIVELPDGIHRGLNRHFVKYTNVLAPNGKPIHILAMNGWTVDRILRARKVLEHFLNDVPDRQWGDKTAMTNAMADNHGTLVLLNDNRDMERVMPALENLNLQFQDLRANESPFEGEPDYMKHQTRDAAYEEVFHLIHASGVLDAMKGYDREIRKLAKQAADSGLWNYDEPNMPGNHFEYIICVYDNYLDLWNTKPTLMEGRRVGKQLKGQSFHGEYKADQRANTRTADPDGFAMIEKFNPNSITYSAELPASFKDNFSIADDGGHRYSEKAKHLLNVTLRGTNKSNLTGNTHNNRLVGNSGDNEMTGNGGDDSLFGGEGNDTACFTGIRSQYTLHRIGDSIEVHDSVANRDGYDVLSSIEKLRFKDISVETASIKPVGNATNPTK